MFLVLITSFDSSLRFLGRSRGGQTDRHTDRQTAAPQTCLLQRAATTTYMHIMLQGLSFSFCLASRYANGFPLISFFLLLLFLWCVLYIQCANITAARPRMNSFSSRTHGVTSVFTWLFFWAVVKFVIQNRGRRLYIAIRTHVVHQANKDLKVKDSIWGQYLLRQTS